MPEIHDGDFGHVFEITFVDSDGDAIDISAANTLQIYMRNNAGTVDTHTAGFTTDGTDGKIDYTTVSGDIDTPGLWQIQGHVTDTGVYQRKTEWGSFTVEANLA